MRRHQITGYVVEYCDETLGWLPLMETVESKADAYEFYRKMAKQFTHPDVPPNFIQIAERSNTLLRILKVTTSVVEAPRTAKDTHESA